MLDAAGVILILIWVGVRLVNYSRRALGIVSEHQAGWSIVLPEQQPIWAEVH